MIQMVSTALCPVEVRLDSHSPACAIARPALEVRPCVRRRRASPPPAVLAAD